MTVPTLSAKIARVNGRVLQSAVAVVTSGYTLSSQAQDWDGRRWSYDITLSATQDQEGRALSAFFSALGGPATPFLFADPSIVQTIGGTPLVKGAGQTGKTLAIDGLPVGALAFRTGDFFSLGTGLDTRLYQITADATANGSGEVTIAFVPALRSSPADNAALEVVSPKVLLRMSGAPPSSVEPAMIFRFSFSAYEAI